MSRTPASTNVNSNTTTPVDFYEALRLNRWPQYKNDHLKILSDINGRTPTQDEICLQIEICQNGADNAESMCNNIKNFDLHKLKAFHLLQTSVFSDYTYLESYSKSLNAINPFTDEHYLFLEELINKIKDNQVELEPKNLPILIERLEAGTELSSRGTLINKNAEQIKHITQLLFCFPDLTTADAINLQGSLSAVFLTSYLPQNSSVQKKISALAEEILKPNFYTSDDKNTRKGAAVLAQHLQNLTILNDIITNKSVSVIILKATAKNQHIESAHIDLLFKHSLMNEELLHLLLNHQKSNLTNEHLKTLFVSEKVSFAESLKISTSPQEFNALKEILLKIYLDKFIPEHVLNAIATNTRTPASFIVDVIKNSLGFSTKTLEAFLIHKKANEDVFSSIAKKVNNDPKVLNSSLVIYLVCNIQNYIEERIAPDFTRSEATDKKTQNAIELQRMICYAFKNNETCYKIIELIDEAIKQNKNFSSSLFYTQGDYLKCLKKCKEYCDAYITAQKLQTPSETQSL